MRGGSVSESFPERSCFGTAHTVPAFPVLGLWKRKTVTRRQRKLNLSETRPGASRRPHLLTRQRNLKSSLSLAAGREEVAWKRSYCFHQDYRWQAEEGQRLESAEATENGNLAPVVFRFWSVRTWLLGAGGCLPAFRAPVLLPFACIIFLRGRARDFILPRSHGMRSTEAATEGVPGRRASRPAQGGQ